MSGNVTFSDFSLRHCSYCDHHPPSVSYLISLVLTVSRKQTYQLPNIRISLAINLHPLLLRRMSQNQTERLGDLDFTRLSSSSSPSATAASSSLPTARCHCFDVVRLFGYELANLRRDARGAPRRNCGEGLDFDGDVERAEIVEVAELTEGSDRDVTHCTTTRNEASRQGSGRMPSCGSIRNFNSTSFPFWPHSGGKRRAYRTLRIVTFEKLEQRK